MFGIESGELAAVAERICAATRAENAAAGARLVAIGELDVLMLRRYGKRESWYSDTAAAITAEISVALRINGHWAASYLYYARALRLRLPKVGAMLCAGEISYSTFKTIVYRTDLITDPQVLAGVDARLANRASRWPSLTRGRLGGYVDKVVARADRDAVRQRREYQAGREFEISDVSSGLSAVYGRLLSTDAHVLDARLDALAATVCAEDPRTRKQRRADALGALAGGAERLACRCGRPECPAAGKPTPSPVLIHMLAESATVAGAGENPGSLIGADALVPAELIAELADSARVRPLIHPGDAAPEPGYTPSQALADFVRCRDLTCRFPSCEEPAIVCDIDHTVAHADGGPTHASNLKCLCRTHHLLKTFWGWHDQQLADGTVIWRAPSGCTYITTPGSALLFPTLCTPTGDLAPPDPDRARQHTDRSERSARMPQRRRTRAEAHARYVAAERSRNRNQRHARQAARQAAFQAAWCTPAPPGADDDPPPF